MGGACQGLHDRSIDGKQTEGRVNPHRRADASRLAASDQRVAMAPLTLLGAVAKAWESARVTLKRHVACGVLLR